MIRDLYMGEGDTQGDLFAYKPDPNQFNHQEGDQLDVPVYGRAENIGKYDPDKWTVGPKNEEGKHAMQLNDRTRFYMKPEHIRHWHAHTQGKQIADEPHPTDKRINNIREGNAKYLGRGMDGLVFDHGDGTVTKTSTVIPFHHDTEWQRTPTQAKRHLLNQHYISQEIEDAGHGEMINPGEYVEHEDASYIHQPWLDTETTPTRSQLDDFANKLKAFHASGYRVGDDLQVGLAPDGSLRVFDTGQAYHEKRQPNRDQKYDRERAMRQLGDLYEKIGEKFVDIPKADERLAFMTTTLRRGIDRKKPMAFLSQHIPQMVEKLESIHDAEPNSSAYHANMPFVHNLLYDIAQMGGELPEGIEAPEYRLDPMSVAESLELAIWAAEEGEEEEKRKEQMRRWIETLPKKDREEVTEAVSITMDQYAADDPYDYDPQMEQERRDLGMKDASPEPVEAEHPHIDNPNFQKHFEGAHPSVKHPSGDPKMFIHGTKAPERVGTEFKPERATSGPMAFFSDSPQATSGYAFGKEDTSAWDSHGWDHPSHLTVGGVPMGDSTEDGGYSYNLLHDAWNQMPAQARVWLRQNARNLGVDYDGNVTTTGEHAPSPTHFDWMQKNEHRGNALNALYDMHAMGNARHDDFVRIMQHIAPQLGIDFKYNDPRLTAPSSIPVTLNITTPLDTSDIPQYLIDDLVEESKLHEREAEHGADPWAKNTMSPEVWIQALLNDQQEGTQLAWTSIPDWVTEKLREYGYDGIIDSGGKYGGEGHTVAIPFEPGQVKSWHGNRGTFDSDNPDIRHSAYSAENLTFAEAVARYVAGDEPNAPPSPDDVHDQESSGLNTDGPGPANPPAPEVQDPRAEPTASPSGDAHPDDHFDPIALAEARSLGPTTTITYMNPRDYLAVSHNDYKWNTAADTEDDPLHKYAEQLKTYEDEGRPFTEIPEVNLHGVDKEGLAEATFGKGDDTAMKALVRGLEKIPVSIFSTHSSSYPAIHWKHQEAGNPRQYKGVWPTSLRYRGGGNPARAPLDIEDPRTDYEPDNELHPMARDIVNAQNDPEATADQRKQMADWKQSDIYSATFKDWFGDWESGQGSKVVKESGHPSQQAAQDSDTHAPIVMHHGSSGGWFDRFEERWGQATSRNSPNSLLYGPGFYFTEAEDIAQDYSEIEPFREIRDYEEDELTDIIEGTQQYLPDGYQIRADPEGGISMFRDGGRWIATLFRPPSSAWNRYGYTPQMVDEEMHREGMESFLHHWNNNVRISGPQKDPFIFTAYLNIRNPWDVAKPLTAEQYDAIFGEDAYADATLSHRENIAMIQENIDAKEPLRMRILEAFSNAEAHDEDTSELQLELDRIEEEIWQSEERKAGEEIRMEEMLTYQGVLQQAGGSKLDLYNQLRAAGFDGITHEGGGRWGDERHRVWIPFTPQQIKSTSNRGTFDPNDDRILYDASFEEMAELYAAQAELFPDGPEEPDDDPPEFQEGVHYSDFDAMVELYKAQSEMFSDKQLEAGNYKLADRLAWNGLRVSIETKKGQKRRPEWKPMSCDYGYIRQHEGADGDKLDIMMGPNRKSELIVVIDQLTEKGRFDEHKVVAGVDSEDEAVKLYSANYPDGWKVGPRTVMTIKQFKTWLQRGDTTRPIEKQVSSYAAKEEAWNAEHARVPRVESNEAKVPQSPARKIPPLRSERDSSLHRLENELHGVSEGHGTETEPRALAGQDRQRRGLRARELSVDRQRDSARKSQSDKDARLQRRNGHASVLRRKVSSFKEAVEVANQVRQDDSRGDRDTQARKASDAQVSRYAADEDEPETPDVASNLTPPEVQPKVPKPSAKSLKPGDSTMIGGLRGKEPLTIGPHHGTEFKPSNPENIVAHPEHIEAMSIEDYLDSVHTPKQVTPEGDEEAHTELRKIGDAMGIEPRGLRGIVQRNVGMGILPETYHQELLDQVEDLHGRAYPEPDFEPSDPYGDDDYFYHVTPSHRLDEIMEGGLRSGEIPNFQTYSDRSSDKVFLTEKGGVEFWHDKLSDIAQSRSDDPAEHEMSVLRIPKSEVQGKLWTDTEGTRDAGKPAYYVQEHEGMHADLRRAEEQSLGSKANQERYTEMQSLYQKPNKSPEDIQRLNVLHSEDYKQNGTRSLAFLNWFGDWTGGTADASKVINKQGEPNEATPYSAVSEGDYYDNEPVLVYHGTTHAFDEFMNDRANVDNAMGAGFYFTTDAHDVQRNYVGGGPDLTGRISQRLDEIQGQEWWDEEQALEEIKEALKAHDWEDGVSEEQEAMIMDIVQEHDPGNYDGFQKIVTEKAIEGLRRYGDVDDIGEWADWYDDMAEHDMIGDHPDGKLITAYLNARNPVVMDTSGGTTFTYEFTPEVSHRLNELEDEYVGAIETHLIGEDDETFDEARARAAFNEAWSDFSQESQDIRQFVQELPDRLWQIADDGEDHLHDPDLDEVERLADQIYDEEWGDTEPTGSLAELIDHLEQRERYYDIEVIAPDAEQPSPSAELRMYALERGMDEVSAEDVYAIIGRYSLNDYDQGMQNYSTEVFRQVMEDMGFDSIQDRRPARRFPNMEIGVDEHHWIVFNANQVKAKNNFGTFNPDDDRYRYGTFAEAVARYAGEETEPINMGQPAPEPEPTEDLTRPEDPYAPMIQAFYDRHPNVSLFVTAPNDTRPAWTMHEIQVPKEQRRQGLGSAAMQDFNKMADQTGHDAVLSPSTDFGGTKTGLNRFYRSHGYKPNKGRMKDFRYRETMIRRPEPIEEPNDDNDSYHATSFAEAVERYAGAKQLRLWNEEDHIREPKGSPEGGQFKSTTGKRSGKPVQSKPMAESKTETTDASRIRKKAPKAKMIDGKYVEMVKAPKNGAVSDVNGKFYKGGRWMPVHGLSVKSEDEPKPKPKKKAEGAAPVAKADGGGRPKARKMSKEQIKAERRRMQMQNHWDRLRDTELGQMVWMGDTKFLAERNMKKFMEGSKNLSNDQLKKIADTAKRLYLKREMKIEPPEDHDDLREHAEWLDENSMRDGWWLNRKQAKAAKEKPDFVRAYNWLDSIIGKDYSGEETVKSLRIIHRAMQSV